MLILHTHISDAHTITVGETSTLYGERGRFRVLQFGDEAVQGAIDLDEPDRIVLEYTRAIIHLMAINQPDFDRVFIIGHGIGTIAGHYRDRRCRTVELDQHVAKLSRQYFDYCGDDILIGDGRRLLEEEANGTHDYIVIDAFDAKGVPRHLYTREMLEMAATKLEDGGMLLMNVFGRGSDPIVSSIDTTLRGQFPYVRAFSMPRQGQAELHNVILCGSARPINYQAGLMAGFREINPIVGHVMTDGQ